MVSDTIKDGVTTLTRKIRARGLKQLAVVAARQNPPVDKLYDAKEGYEGTYKLVKGKSSSGDVFKGPFVNNGHRKHVCCDCYRCYCGYHYGQKGQLRYATSECWSFCVLAFFELYSAVKSLGACSFDAGS